MALKSTTKKSVKPAVSAKASAAPKTTAKSKPTAKAKSVKAAPVSDSHKIIITYFAPEAGSVAVAGDFTQWETAPVTLVKEETGTWKTTLALKPGKYQYRLLVDGQWQNDPQCQELQPNEFGSANCVLSVAA